KHGPKSTFPTNQLFYVTGKVDEQPGKDETREIYAVFVRYWWGPWSLPPSGRAPKSCTEVEHALDGREVSRAHLQATKPKFRDIWSPTSTAGDPSKADADHFTWLTSQARVLVAKGAVDDSKRFAALANDPSFFHHGARYCVFVYRAERKT